LTLFLLNHASFSRHQLCFLVFFVVYIPIYGVLRMLIASDGELFRFNDTSYILSSFLFLFTLMIFNEKTIRVNDFFLKVTLYSLVVLIYIVFYLPLNESRFIVGFFMERGSLYLSTRKYSDFEIPYVYFIISPLLILLLSRNLWAFLRKKNTGNFLLVLFVFGALLLSGTRMNALIALATLLMTILWYYKNRIIHQVLLNAFFWAIFILILYFFSDFLSAIFSSKDISNAKKIHDLMLMSEILSDPVTLLFGQGFNAYDWSPLTRQLIATHATKIELTYLEFIRVFGLLNFLVLFLFLISFMVKTDKFFIDYGWSTPALISYIFVSSLNPYLFSLNGVLAIGTCLSIYFVSASNKNMNTSS